jgi:hypothetical protein
MRFHPRLAGAVLALSSLGALGCGPTPPAEAPLDADPPGLPAVDPPAASTFENPGGMWMPSQLASQGDALRQAGFALDAATLSDPTRAPLGAVISLGGCSASFVSNDGLVITNHHCVTRALQVNSTPKENLLQDGFVAKDRKDERSAGPTQRVFVTQGFRDVTGEVRQGLDAITDDLERFKKIEEREKTIVAACEKGRSQIRCSVRNYFEGASYILIEQLEIRDVRLVYAPPEMIGSYGGEIDNWRWPRHAGDFAFYRAYVGKDGKPADFDEANVPYHPPHYLRLASEPLRPGAAVLVAGYPASTSRLTTAAEVEEAVAWRYPRRVQFCEEYIALLEGLAKSDDEIAIKAEPLIRGLSNWLTNTRGMLDGLVQDGLAKKRKELQAELQAFIDADPSRKAKWGDAFDKMAALQKERERTRDADAALFEATWLPGLLRGAGTLVRMAEERPKPDEERDPDYQERNWKLQEQGLASLSQRYHRTLEKRLLSLGAARELRLPEKDRPGISAAILGGRPATQENIDKAIDDIYGKTKLEDEKTRASMFQKATLAELKKSPDPLVKLALKLRPMIKAMEERDERYQGAMAGERPRYIEALRAFRGGNLAPDANGTLRVTFGTVRGYRPKPDAPVYHPFTKLSELVAKHTGEDPFDAPAALRKAVAEKRFGAYVDEELGEVPVDFLADLDITGGNSGSATLNGKGELVGLAFDGNYEAMASDWLFMPEVTRSIHVDLRYILWVLDAVSRADALLAELGVKPTAR